MITNKTNLFSVRKHEEGSGDWLVRSGFLKMPIALWPDDVEAHDDDDNDDDDDDVDVEEDVDIRNSVYWGDD
uniref:Uncharacterized protein n=1 Tax=Glossina brevipalpis TaxID=37001 RepID=A0A1A9X143_9MUSC